MTLLEYGKEHETMLREDARDLVALVARYHDAKLRGTRIGEWTAKEIIGHLTDAAELFAERVRRCIAEERPGFPDFDAEGAVAMRRHNEADAKDLAARFAAASREIARLLAAPRNAARLGVHELQGERTAGHFGAYHAAHARGHLEELRSRLE